MSRRRDYLTAASAAPAARWKDPPPGAGSGGGRWTAMEMSGTILPSTRVNLLNNQKPGARNYLTALDHNSGYYIMVLLEGDWGMFR